MQYTAFELDGCIVSLQCVTPYETENNAYSILHCAACGLFKQALDDIGTPFCAFVTGRDKRLMLRRTIKRERIFEAGILQNADPLGGLAGEETRDVGMCPRPLCGLEPNTTPRLRGAGSGLIADADDLVTGLSAFADIRISRRVCNMGRALPAYTRFMCMDIAS